MCVTGSLEGLLPWHGVMGAPSLTGRLRRLLPRSSLVLHNITRGIFEAIVEQAPFAIEDLMNELDAQEEDEDGKSEDGDLEWDVPSKESGEGEGQRSCGRAPIWPSKLLCLRGSLHSPLVCSPCFRPAPSICPWPGSQGMASLSWSSSPGLQFSGCCPDSLALL